VTSPASGASSAADLPGYAPIPRSALGPALNDQGYYVGRVERNLYRVTDGVYQSAFLATADGVVLFDAPPSIGGNLRRAVDQIAAANGVTNTVTHLVYSHHHADHAGAASLFGQDVARVGHQQTRRLLRDDDLDHHVRHHAIAAPRPRARRQHTGPPLTTAHRGHHASAGPGAGRA
jgi:glyoxylase-like metal-dependent hydrolase (beta-lactamase superfamily II)